MFCLFCLMFFLCFNVLLKVCLQWPFPVLLEALTSQELITKYLNNQNNYLIDSWYLSNIKNENQPSIMPIISPKFPEQNVAFNINEYTKSIILRETKKASDHFKNLNHNNLTKEWWQKTIFKKINYKLIYKHFILVICTVPIKIKENINNYFGNFKCGLLKTKLRLMLKEWAEKINGEKIKLEEYHTISGFEKERKCERINGTEEHWTVWLVGINLKDNENNIEEQQKQENLILTINEQFLNINREGSWLNAVYIKQNYLEKMFGFLLF
uniref:polynucleotide adenylyltransferase n=1 Tax=Meloidogyne enterolobii TaxID=390850 RepID=A0A6V7UQU7_MELEN|nr:unnamed protein product [Meloidogyne enterolobii]